MLALLAPLQSHCLLEHAGLVSAALGCQSETPVEAGHDQPAPCKDQPRCAFERPPIYQTISVRVTVLPPSLSVFLGSLDVIENARPSFAMAEQLAAVAPGEIAVGWQFHSRTAMQPRAPALSL
jgi:hypothetical protein